MPAGRSPASCSTDALGPAGSRSDLTPGGGAAVNGRSYISEFAQEYNPDRQITYARTPTNEANPALRDLIGQNIRGDKELEIPVSNRETPIPQEILDYARSYDIDIVDIEGHLYN